jgi:hypothetical protein
VASSRGSHLKAIVVYTVLRVALLAAVWLVIELLTPIHGVWALVIALLFSGVISVVLLDRQRGAVGSVAEGFFGRLNARIEASTRAEDEEDDVDLAPAPSGEGEARPEDHPVDQQ